MEPGIEYLFSANGASIISAWGTAPGIQITVQTSAESASQSDGRIKVVADENRAFSAGFFWPINPGALPQARGEHVAPLALNTCEIVDPGFSWLSDDFDLAN